MYDSGLGVKEDAKMAVMWYTKAVEQNYSAAASNLGVLYKNGLGCEQNYTTALHLFKQAADRDNLPQAMGNLGIMHEEGLGVERSVREAVRWFKKAIKLGDEASQAKLAEIIAKGKATAAKITSAPVCDGTKEECAAKKQETGGKGKEKYAKVDPGEDTNTAQKAQKAQKARSPGTQTEGNAKPKAAQHAAQHSRGTQAEGNAKPKAAQHSRGTQTDTGTRKSQLIDHKL